MCRVKIDPIISGRVIIPVSLILPSVIAILFTEAFAAGDRTVITVTGKLLANTCTIDTGKSTLHPVLPTMSSRDMKGKGTTGGEREVSIVLADCGADASEVRINVSGPADAGDQYAFRNISSDKPATGLGIYFYQINGAGKFKPDGSLSQDASLYPGQTNTLKFKVSYVSTYDTPTAGNFKTLVTMQINYK